MYQRILPPAPASSSCPSPLPPPPPPDLGQSVSVSVWVAPERLPRPPQPLLPRACTHAKRKEMRKNEKKIIAQTSARLRRFVRMHTPCLSVCAPRMHLCVRASELVFLCFCVRTRKLRSIVQFRTFQWPVRPIIRATRPRASSIAGPRHPQRTPFPLAPPRSHLIPPSTAISVCAYTFLRLFAQPPAVAAHKGAVTSENTQYLHPLSRVCSNMSDLVMYVAM
jgi:hypothetical protein